MLRPGDEPIPGYRLEQFLGRGQFGEVWRTTAPGGGRAALKFLDLGGKQGWKEFRGIQSVKKIRHPHLMPITALWLLDENWKTIDDAAVDRLSTPEPAAKRLAQTLRVGETVENGPEPRWLVVAQLLGDKTLGERLQECERAGDKGIPPEELLRYMEEAAKGIDFLNSAKHDLGHGTVSVQHCDIKPANILLLGDSVLICDYGVAQVLADGDTAATSTGMIGSPAYMAPECVERRPSFASDQYSLAVTYVELRTGALPFRTESYYEVIDAHRHGKLDLTRLSPAERAVIRKATAVDPRQRFPSTLEMVRELALAIHGEKAGQGSSRRQLGLLTATLLTVALAAYGLIRGWLPTPAPTVHAIVQVEPVDATVEIDGQAAPLDGQGQVEFEVTGTQPRQLRVSKSPEFDPIELTVRSEQAAAGPVRVVLEPSVPFLVNRAWQHLAAGEFDQTVQDLAVALKRQPELAQWPAAQPLLPPDATRPIKRMLLTPNGQSLVAASRDGAIYRWELTPWHDAQESAAAPQLVIQSPKGIEQLAISDQHVVWVDQVGTVTVRDLAAPSTAQDVIQFSLVDNSIEVEFSRDGRWLLTSSDDGQGEFHLAVRDREERFERSRDLGTHRDVIDEIRSTPDSTGAVSAGWDGVAMWWSLDGAVSHRPLAPFDGDLYGVAVTPRVVILGGEGTLASAALPDTELRRHRLVGVPLPDGAAQVFPEGHEDVIEVVVANRAGDVVASGSADTTIHVWRMDEANMPQGPTILVGHRAVVTSIQLDTSGLLCASTSDDGMVAFWDLSHIERRGPHILGQHRGGGTAVVLSDDGRWLISAGADGAVWRWPLDRCQAVIRASAEAGIRLPGEPVLPAEPTEATGESTPVAPLDPAEESATTEPSADAPVSDDNESSTGPDEL